LSVARNQAIHGKHPKQQILPYCHAFTHQNLAKHYEDVLEQNLVFHGEVRVPSPNAIKPHDMGQHDTGPNGGQKVLQHHYRRA
jgi:hypothetical protein